MGKKFIIAIDLGTTGNRVYCIDEKGFSLGSAYKEFTQHFPQPGWVEHDPVEIWDDVCTLINTAIHTGNLSAHDIIAIGITNQRETTVLWDKSSGKPIHNAIVWQCRRTAEICMQLREKGLEPLFREKTGLVLDAYFSGTKIKWLLENVDGAMQQARNGELLFGTIDTWILWNLTGRRIHKTDYTNASRTLIFDIRQLRWSSELLDILGIPTSLLPEVCVTASHFGVTAGVPGIPDGVLIGAMVGDQQSAMVGQNCVFEGTLKNTYGTGCFVLLNNGSSLVISQNGLLTTIMSDNHGKPVYGLEGSVFIGGAVIQWLRDYMGFFTDSSESQGMALSVHKKSDVVLVPAFVGLGAPYWKMDTRGAIFGLTRDTTKDEIVSAALKSIAFQSFDVIDAMQRDTQKNIDQLRVDGGAARNAFLMQFQSDILGIPVVLPEITESTALGAAYLAGLSAGVYSSIDEVARYNKIVYRYEPKMSREEQQHQLSLWRDAVHKLL